MPSVSETMLQSAHHLKRLSQQLDTSKLQAPRMGLFLGASQAERATFQALSLRSMRDWTCIMWLHRLLR